MSFSEQLLEHAWNLLTSPVGGQAQEDIRLRRAISAAYYALFHHLTHAAAALLAPNVDRQTNFRVQRWFEHAELKRVCAKFLQAKLDQPLRSLLGESASEDMQIVAQSFIQLQAERHNADYDLGYRLEEEDAIQLLSTATEAFASWDRIATSAEANIFILSLLLPLLLLIPRFLSEGRRSLARLPTACALESRVRTVVGQSLSSVPYLSHRCSKENLQEGLCQNLRHLL